MNHYAQRLSRLQRSFGVTCGVHDGESLVCQTCEPSEPYPHHVARGMRDLIDSIVARVPREVLTAKAIRVGRPPVQEPCSRCGTRQTCLSCQVRYGHALLAAVGLTPDERATLETLLNWCRMIDSSPSNRRGTRGGCRSSRM
jgi:hypothetical protein